MGAGLRRTGKAAVIGMFTVIALFASAWLALATAAPSGQAGYPGTTTTTVQVTSTTSVPKVCKPGYGYGDRNHCHSGPPGHHRSNRRRH